MKSESQTTTESLSDFVTSTRKLAGIGAGIALVAAFVGQSFQTVPFAAISAVNLGVAGLVVVGLAIARCPKDSGTLLIGSVTAGLAALATHPDWDSIRLMQWVMAGVAAVFAVVLLLPPVYQRVAVSLFVLYHFAGILSAVTSPPPTPWLTGQLWSRFFRNHLEFCYVNNAYQFYSPQPGPANLLWFCIYGDDNKSCWYIIPKRDERLDPLGVEYFRRLSLTERANQNLSLTLGPPPEAVQLRGMATGKFPLHPRLLPGVQYRVPNEHSRHILSGYASHIIANREHYAGRDFGPIRTVKVYLTQHRMLSQKEFADGKDPYDPDTYLPFFVGEYDAEGKLTDPYDPLLYWIVPIVRQPGSESVTNYVAIHAGSDPLASRETGKKSNDRDQKSEIRLPGG